MLVTVESTVTSKGQVTLPAAARRVLNVRSGDRLRWDVYEDGTITVRKVGQRTLEALVGMLGRPERSLTIEQMDDVVACRALEKGNRVS